MKKIKNKNERDKKCGEMRKVPVITYARELTDEQQRRADESC